MFYFVRIVSVSTERSNFVFNFSLSAFHFFLFFCLVDSFFSVTLAFNPFTKETPERTRWRHTKNIQRENWKWNEHTQTQRRTRFDWATTFQSITIDFSATAKWFNSAKKKRNKMKKKNANGPSPSVRKPVTNLILYELTKYWILLIFNTK